MTARLFIRERRKVTLGDAVAAVAGINAIDVAALVYAPGFCKFGRLDSGQLQGPPDLRDLHGHAITEAFEARIFCEDWELRWLRSVTSGRAAFLSEEQNLVPIGFDILQSVEIEAVDRDDEDEHSGRRDRAPWNRYLLWGERAEPDAEEKRRLNGDDRWTKLTTARIGTLWAPHKSTAKRIQLTACEYWQRMAHGNVAVVAERLTGFQDASSGEQRDQDDG